MFVNILCCLFLLGLNMLKGNGYENRTDVIECKEENIQHWARWNWYNVNNETGIICGVHNCYPNCTCTLADANVTSDCTSDNVIVSSVIYPSETIKYLKWKNIILHDIHTKAFLRFGSSLRGLHLYNISLQHLQPGIFAGLKSLTHLDLRYNKLDNLLPGVFIEVLNLTHLDLDVNSLSEINVGVFRGLIRLERLDLGHNRLNRIAEGAFENLTQLQELSLQSNRLLEINVGVFKGLIRLEYLDLFNNSLNRIAEGAFDDLVQLQHLILRVNKISELQVVIFQNLIHLQTLDISFNKLESLPKDIFVNLQQLAILGLSYNNIHRIPAGLFDSCIHLTILDLRSNPLLWIEKNALADLNENVTLVVTDYATCCFTSADCQSSPPVSPYLTYKRLLPYDLLRIAIWFVCSFALFGNILVMCTRLIKKQQGNNVQLLLITNLSISDFLMGIYLAILLSADLYYTKYFPSYSESWRHSTLCRLAGALSVLSSEASAFFITLITIDRFLGIKYTFSKFRPGSKSTRIIVTLLWMIALSISIAIFVLSKEDSDIYAASEICVGLPISRTPVHQLEKNKVKRKNNFFYKYRKYEYTGSRVGMFFSIALFTGLNFICFFVIGYCYVAIFIYVRQTTKQSGRSPNLNEEIRMAMKMSLIVFTDFCCWVPIGILSILTQTGVVVVNPVAYAWIATFVLPINCSLNPALYTLASYVSDKVKYTRKAARKDRTLQERVSMRATTESLNQALPKNSWMCWRFLWCSSFFFFFFFFFSFFPGGNISEWGYMSLSIGGFKVP